MWVLTKVRKPEGSWEITYWSPTSGQRWLQSGGHPYSTVDCAFNGEHFYASCQADNGAVVSTFDFEDDATWKEVNPVKLKSVVRFVHPPLLWVSNDARELACSLERRFMQLIETHRGNEGMRTLWDDDLASVFTQALCEYERQRVYSLTDIDLSTFHVCVRGKIGDGYTFKGFPVNGAHTDENKYLQAVTSSPVGKEILDCPADGTRFACRVWVRSFAEEMKSVWIMIGCRYKNFA